MIPVASELMEDGNNVFIGSGDEHLDFFRSEIDGLKYIPFPGFRIRYSRCLPQYLMIFLKIPSFILQIIREHRLLKQIIREYSIDIVISDSRPGLWNRNIKTVFVTHMMRVPHPKGFRFLGNAGQSLTRRLFAKFNYCYIPDLPGENNLSGKLSHNIDIPANVRYTGILSRFAKETLLPYPDKKYYSVVILSGPEPQRTILKQKMISILSISEKHSVILEGKPGEKNSVIEKGNITFISHLPAKEMGRIILESEHIVTRSGYTTLMELVSLGRSALIIPTPGQSEQEYLAELMDEKGWFSTLSQDNLKADIKLPGSDSVWPDGLMQESRSLLTEALRELLED
jgi:hypothetical protein